MVDNSPPFEGDSTPYAERRFAEATIGDVIGSFFERCRSKGWASASALKQRRSAIERLLDDNPGIEGDWSEAKVQDVLARLDDLKHEAPMHTDQAEEAAGRVRATLRGFEGWIRDGGKKPVTWGAGHRAGNKVNRTKADPPRQTAEGNGNGGAPLLALGGGELRGRFENEQAAQMFARMILDAPQMFVRAAEPPIAA
jgi:hypothetical protein